MKTFITVGYVAVYVPVFDCEGTQRTIDFPRIGGKLYGQANYHWTAKPWLKVAKAAATKALRLAMQGGF
jgi:hypothetical protein